MSQQTIELSGIVRNLPDNVVKDGTMQELINLRPRDGALRPVGKKSRTAVILEDVRFIHTINDNVKVYVGTSNGTIRYRVNTNGVFLFQIDTFIPASEEMSFASLKNALMVSNHTLETTIIMLFDVDTNEYLVFDSGIPDIQVVVGNSTVSADDWSDIVNTSLQGDYNEAMLAQYIMAQKQEAEKGYLTGQVLVRFTWELFDGTIIKHTIPTKVLTSVLTITGSVVDGAWQIARNFTARNIKFTPYGIDAAFKAKYKDVIRGLKVYVTLPRSPEMIETGETRTIEYHEKPNTLLGYIFRGSNPNAIRYTYDVANLASYKPDPASVNEYYLLKDYKLEELSSATAVTITNDTVLDLAMREQISIDNMTHHSLYAKYLFNYNERVFLGNIKTSLYSGNVINFLTAPEIPWDVDASFGAEYNVAIEFDLMSASRGTRTVMTPWKSINTYNLAGTHMYFNIGRLSDYWGYPDARAINARVLIKLGAAIKRITDTVRLTSNQILNFAYSPTIIYKVEFSTLSDYTPVAGKNSYWDYNRVQATELMNPFYFPAINSYRIGSGKVLGMSTNVTALSQGQFGQFPIFCFTSDGIWTMNIGSGETLINTITPLSRHVCNNPESITPIDGGTAFTTTKGLFIISGTEVIEISSLAEGKHNSRITGTLNYEAIANNPNLYQIKDYLCAVPFLTYISGAKIAWDHAEDHKELIISNNSYNYSWVYNLPSKMWYKISQVWENFVNDYPKTYGYKIEGLGYWQDDLNEEDYSEYIPVHIETRPIKLSTKAFKMINRILVQGDLSNPESPFSINLFGSTNNITWHLMNNGRIFPNGYLPFLIGRTTFSCRYFILVLGGKVDEDFYLTHVEVDFDERYHNKLR